MRLGRRILERFIRGCRALREKPKPKPPIPVRIVPPVPTIPTEVPVIPSVEVPTFVPEVRVKPPPLPPEKKTLVYPIIPRKPEKGEPIYAYARISWDPKLNRYLYELAEPPLPPKLREVLERIKGLIEERLEIEFTRLRKFEAVEYLHRQVDELIGYFRIKLSKTERAILHYYIERDFIGLGKIEAFMRDPNIEDISCDGVGLPIYIFHRDPEIASVVTNVRFDRAEELDAFITRLAQLCGKSISVAQPLVGGTLPDGSRLQATLATDIARKGSNFTIRKFREEPLTPIDLLNYRTIDVRTLAYLWYLVDQGRSLLIAGGTAAGKTAFLNVLSLFIRPEKKIISIEDSVAGDSLIKVRDGDRYELISIEELFLKAKGKRFREWDRDICVPQNLKVCCLDRRNKVVLAPISRLIRRRVEKDLFEIVTFTGRKIKVTGDHSLFKLNFEGKLSSVRVRDLRSRDFLALARILPHHQKLLRFIPLTKYLDKLDSLYVRGDLIASLLSQPQVKNSLRVPSQRYLYWKRGKLMPSEVFLKVMENRPMLTEELQGLRLTPKHPAKHGLPILLPLDKSLLTFVGLWLADGCYDRNSVIITNAHPACRAIVKRVGKMLGIRPKTHSDGVSLTLNSKALKEVMKALCLMGNAYTKKIPGWVHNLSKTQIAWLLRGYCSGDGHVARAEIELSSCSAQLVKDVQNLLLYFGIVARTSWRRERDNTYKLRISDVKMLRTFKREIGFIQDYKRRALSQLCQRKVKEVADVIPLPKHFYRLLKKGLRGWIGKSLTYNSWKSWHRRYLHSNIGRTMLQRVLREAPSDEYLFSLAFSDLYWDRIKSIRRVGRKPTFVFDISVPDVENFVANGFIAHNTAEIKLPHPHWVPSVARVPIATVPGKEVDLYALLRESLRVRPDYIIVGEVRGPEAYILFQQIATGHPSMATIHAENMPRLIDRLTTAPISLPLSLIASLDIIVFMAAMTHKGKYVRKVTEVIEMREFDPKARKLLTDTIFKWNPLMDRWDAVTRSRVLGLISKLKAIPEAEIADELRRRMTVLNWMWEQGIKHYKDVYKVICDYYADPELVLRAAMMG